MCGICGILNVGSGDEIKEDTIRRMCSVMEYRGPDDEGIYSGWEENGKKNVGLGIRRLAIIDLETGHQPIHNEDKTIQIVCNGEIYNFQELRKELESQGHYFYTNSDVETIVHLYETHGIDCLKFLRGMFAFAIWDNRKKSLFLARDRIGQKPLCYTEYRGQLIFASEIKSILQIPGIPREVNLEAIHHYLTYRYVPAPLTAFKNITKLPPAHYLVWEKGKVSVNRYWNLNRFFAPLRMTGSGVRMTGSGIRTTGEMRERDYCERIRELLEEAVKLRLVSDVPLGTFLSGGIDSSIITGLMSKLMNKPVKTFSIGFEDKAYDELQYARTIARHFKTDHHEYVVKPDAIEILPKLIWHYNEPFADSSSIPSYYVAKETRREVTVALNGDGGDENFAGYPRYKALRIAEYYDRMPLKIRKFLQKTAMQIPPQPNRKSFLWRMNKFLKPINLTREQRYVNWICFFDNDEKNRLYTPSFKEETKGIDSFDYLNKYHEMSGCDDFLDSALFTDIMTYLPDDLLVKIDIAAMANSLEARSPFLDHKFIEFAASIPSNLKLHGLGNKYILKKAFSDFLPPSILSRTKMGFAVPISKWLRSELKEYACEILLDKHTVERGYFRKKYIKQLFDEHCREQYDHGYLLWTLLNFELWHRMFIDRVPDSF